MPKGSHHTPEARAQMRSAHIGVGHSVESRKKIRLANIGKQLTPETKRKIGLSNLGKCLGRRHTKEELGRMRAVNMTPEARKRNRRSALMRERPHFSLEAPERLRQAHLGTHATTETRNKMSIARIGKRHTPETIAKMRTRAHESFENPEYIKKWGEGLRSKTRPEKHMDTVLQALYPADFKYNGRFDCGISIGRMIPDFVNVNGRKQVIDVHGSYWHKGEDVSERIARHAKYGYSALIIWDYELKNEKAVVDRIVTFVGSEPHQAFH